MNMHCVTEYITICNFSVQCKCSKPAATQSCKDMTKRLIVSSLRAAKRLTGRSQQLKYCTSANLSLRSKFACFASAEVLRGLNLFFPACESPRGLLAAAQPSECRWRRILNLHGEKKSRAGQCVSGGEGTRGRGDEGTSSRARRRRRRWRRAVRQRLRSDRRLRADRKPLQKNRLLGSTITSASVGARRGTVFITKRHRGR